LAYSYKYYCNTARDLWPKVRYSMQRTDEQQCILELMVE